MNKKQRKRRLDRAHQHQKVCRSRISEKLWNELVATAKKRKRAVQGFAEKAGFRLRDEGLDPTDRKSYVRV